MNNQTNQEQKNDKGTEAGINPEVIKLDFQQLKEGLSGFVGGGAQRTIASGGGGFVFSQEA